MSRYDVAFHTFSITGEHYATSGRGSFSFDDTGDISYEEWQDQLIDAAEAAADQAADALMDERYAEEGHSHD
jgi:hypothetical protein